MSNEAITPITKTYPVFEANQVLSHDHLNDLRTYFDTEILSTRNQLIGVGIVSGLEFNMEADGITIYGGAGISTNGHLISSRYDSQKYESAIPYTFKNAEDPMLQQVLDSLTDKTVERNGKTIRQTRNLTGIFVDLTVSFYEMVLEDDPRLIQNDEVKAVATMVPTGKDAGVALYLESVDIDIESCFTTNCDERGIEKIQTIRPLLIVTNKDTRLKTVFDRPAIPALRRIMFAQSNAPDLTGSFSTALNEGMLDELQNAIDRTDSYLGRLLQNRPVRNAAHPLKAIKNTIQASNPLYLPCFYEWVRDLNRALNDLLDKAKDLEVLTHMLPDTFAEYLMLGPITSNSSDFTRTQFVPAQSNEDHEARLEEIRFYWKRLLALIAGFDPKAQGGINITPSHTDAHDLTKQSLPYYYNLENASVNEYWSHELHSRGKSNEVLGYFSSTYNTASHIIKPLEYDHEQNDLLLIEDYIGLQKSDAVTQLQALKKSNHLSFGIVALRVSNSDHDAAYPLPVEDDPLAIREDNFKNFLEENPGLYHARGIRKDGTLVLVFKAEPDDTDGKVIAGLALPYICCGVKTIKEEPAPFLLDAHDDNVVVDAGTETDINVLINDDFDPNNPVELDLVDDFTINAVNDTIEANTGAVIEIHALENDRFDSENTIEVELLNELVANDVSTNLLTGESEDIDVLKNDHTDTGDVELDFADQP